MISLETTPHPWIACEVLAPVADDAVEPALVSGEDGSPWYEGELTSPGAYARRTGGALAEQLLSQGAGVVIGR